MKYQGLSQFYSEAKIVWIIFSIFVFKLKSVMRYHMFNSLEVDFSIFVQDRFFVYDNICCMLRYCDLVFVFIYFNKFSVVDFGQLQE